MDLDMDSADMDMDMNMGHRHGHGHGIQRSTERRVELVSRVGQLCTLQLDSLVPDPPRPRLVPTDRAARQRKRCAQFENRATRGAQSTIAPYTMLSTCRRSIGSLGITELSIRMPRSCFGSTTNQRLPAPPHEKLPEDRAQP
jgi:hypothetical protein